MRIGVSTVGATATDISVWSGTPASFLVALKRLHSDVVALDPPAPVTYRGAQLLTSFSARAGRRWHWETSLPVLRRFTREMQSMAEAKSVDVVVSMGWLPFLPQRSATPPTIYWGDATLSQKINSYPYWSSLNEVRRKRAIDVEMRSLIGLAAVAMPSAWACGELVAGYGLKSSQVHRIPFGSNVSDPGAADRVLSNDGLRVLTVGVHWHRKGMDRAVLAIDRLRSRGIEAQLDVVGVEAPDKSWMRPYVRYHGRLSKGDPHQAAELNRLYREAHVFLLASRHDPFPMVLAEAGAHSLPVVATDVGGIRDRVDRGGMIVSEHADPEELSDALAAVIASEGRYGALSRSSRRDFEVNSNWKRSAALMLELCSSVERVRR